MGFSSAARSSIITAISFRAVLVTMSFLERGAGHGRRICEHGSDPQPAPCSMPIPKAIVVAESTNFGVKLLYREGY